MLKCTFDPKTLTILWKRRLHGEPEDDSFVQALCSTLQETEALCLMIKAEFSIPVSPFNTQNCNLLSKALPRAMMAQAHGSLVSAAHGTISSPVGGKSEASWTHVDEKVDLKD